MKKLLKPIFNSKFGFLIREKLGLKSPIFLIENETSFLSSDLFFWRTDNGFSTIFKASDILQKYYSVNSKIILYFFNENGNFLTKKIFNFKYGLVTIKITSKFLKQEGKGTFIALNIPTSKLESNVKVTNRCYIGYGREDNHSMVHGNMIAIKTNPYKVNFDRIENLIPAVSSRKGNYQYYLQKPNESSKKMFLIFTNPLERTIKVIIEGQKYEILKKACINIEIRSNKELVIVKSDFIWPRPLVWTEKKGFIDVHHG